MPRSILTGLLLVLILGSISATEMSNSPTSSDRDIRLTRDNFVVVRNTIDGTSTSNLINKMMSIKDRTLYVYINTPGGSVQHGDQIIHVMNTLQRRGIEIVCISNVALSMGFTITQYCPTRLILQSSVFMQHQMSTRAGGPLRNLNAYLSMSTSMSQQMDIQEAMRLNMTIEQFRDKVQHDWWLYGQDIIDNKAADGYAYVVCDFENEYTQETVDTWFGQVILTYSLCPVARDPLKYEFPSDMSAESRFEFIKNHDINQYIENRMKANKL